MIRLEVNNGAMVEDFDYSDGMTVLDLVKQFQDAHNFRFRNAPIIVDTSQGVQLQPIDPVIDERYYAMQVWIDQQVNDDGIPITRI